MWFFILVSRKLNDSWKRNFFWCMIMDLLRVMPSPYFRSKIPPPSFNHEISEFYIALKLNSFPIYSSLQNFSQSGVCDLSLGCLEYKQISPRTVSRDALVSASCGRARIILRIDLPKSWTYKSLNFWHGFDA